MAVDAPSRIELEIGGMTCTSCAARVEKKLNKLGGVVVANVNYATELASVAYDPGHVRVPDLVRTVEAAGYTAALPSDTDAKADLVRPLRVRLLVSLTLTFPLLLLAMVPPLQFRGWEWIAFALATPVVLWAGLAFHRAAVLNARHLTATMDTLVSLGTLAAWSWSVVVLVAGLNADVYFEVAGVITTLILLGSTKVGAETALAQIASLVAEAQTGKAPIQRLVDRISAVFVPVVLVVSLGTLVGWLAIAGNVGDAFTAAVAVLILGCACGLGLAAPAGL